MKVLHDKNHFDVGIILGDLFSNDPTEDAGRLLAGDVEVAFPTYFLFGKHGLHPAVRAKLEESDGQLCHNLWFAGKRAVIKTGSIRIVSLCGSPDPSPHASRSDDPYDLLRTDGDAKSLHGANTADILVTSQWPKGVSTGAIVKPADAALIPEGEGVISNLCTALKPRYHFTTSDGLFYEREPFSHEPAARNGVSQSYTRFISLASYKNQAKQKWLYAFSIDPHKPVADVPPYVTPSPFSITNNKRTHGDLEWKNGGRDANRRFETSTYRGPKRQKAKALPGPESCFFCLSNPNLATHLITSIGDEAYLTTAKGPLTTKTSFPSLTYPAHMLILPLAHIPVLSAIQPPEVRKTTQAEMIKYRLALQDLVNTESNGQLGLITWEIARQRGVHAHWQCLPVASEMVANGLVEAAFQLEAENEQLGAFRTQEGSDDSVKVECEYVRIWIWGSSRPDTDDKDGDATKIRKMTKNMVLELGEDVRFDLQFPRKVMAKLIGLEQRFQWRDCQQSEAEESEDAAAFKAAFEAYDPAR